jgi:hypothetical protein
MVNKGRKRIIYDVFTDQYGTFNIKIDHALRTVGFSSVRRKKLFFSPPMTFSFDYILMCD